MIYWFQFRYDAESPGDLPENFTTEAQSMTFLQSVSLYGFAPWLEVLLAAALELLLGKSRFFHPVKWLKRIVARLDDRIRLSFGRSQNPNYRQAAIAAAVCFPLAGFLIGWLLPWLFMKLWGSLAASIARIVLLYLVFSLRQPLWNSVRIFSCLRKGDKENARRLLGFFTEKDTEALSEQGICRTACEELSLSLSEGALLPLLFASFGALVRLSPSGSLNAALAWAAVLLYDLCAAAEREFDTCPAYTALIRLIGSWVCYLPARLSAALTMLSAWILRLNWKNASAVLLTSARTLPFLSRGWSMGAFAGALSIRFGGGAYYQKQWRAAPSLGTDFATPDTALLRKAAFLTVLSFALALLLCLLSPLIAVLAALLAGSLGALPSGGFGRRS